MRLKTIMVNGRYISARDGMVLVRGGYPELSFEQMDDVVARMEVLEKLQPNEPLAAWRPPVTKSGGYVAEIIRDGNEVLLIFGCWTVGNTAKVKKAVEELREINKDPEMKPAPGVVELPNRRGYFVKVQDGHIKTVSEDGVETYETIITLENAAKALAAMEFRKNVPVPETPTDVIVEGYGEAVYLKYACQTFSITEVKQILEALNQPVTQRTATAS